MKEQVLALIREYLQRPDVQQSEIAVLVLNALAGDVQMLKECK